MNTLERLVSVWLIRRLLTRYEGWHKRRLMHFLEVLGREAEATFPEDNKATIKAFLGECLDEAIPLRP